MLSSFLQKSLLCPKCKSENLTYSVDTVSCTDCKTLFSIQKNVPLLLIPQTPQPDTHFDYITHYQKDADVFDYYEERSGATLHNETRVHQSIISQVPKEVNSILDVGCGSAWVAKEFSPKGKNVVSMDISLPNTSKALELYPSDNHAAIVADAYHLPFKVGAFDCIIASEIIEHTAQPQLFVESLMSILKPNGVLIITTPYKEKLIYSLCIHCNHLTPHNAHIHSFDEKNLASLYSSPFQFHTFGNKVLIHLRTHIILRFLSFRLWKIIDAISNAIVKKPLTILAKYTKT